MAPPLATFSTSVELRSVSGEGELWDGSLETEEELRLEGGATSTRAFTTAEWLPWEIKGFLKHPDLFLKNFFECTECSRNFSSELTPRIVEGKSFRNLHKVDEMHPQQPNIREEALRSSLCLAKQGAVWPSAATMTHVKRFQSIPMSKSMRFLCKEEDYAFLGASGSSTKGSPEDWGALEENWKGTKEVRACRRLGWEQQEKERLRAIEDSKKEREQQWRRHVAEVTSSQETTLQDRRTRLHSFREFQRKVLAEEEGMEGAAVHQLVTRM